MALTISTAARQQTDEQKLEGYTQAINLTLLQSSKHIARSLETVQGLILANPDGFTKEQVREAHGQADELDAIAEKAIELLAMLTVE